VPAEITTYCFYPGRIKDFLVANAIFRMGGAAVLMTNKPSLMKTSKYQLSHCVRIHTGQDDSAYRCVGAGWPWLLTLMLAGQVHADRRNCRSRTHVHVPTPACRLLRVLWPSAHTQVHQLGPGPRGHQRSVPGQGRAAAGARAW
jgi:hypothetical protein